MKTKISLLLILFALFYGCTTSSSDTTTPFKLDGAKGITAVVVSLELVVHP